MKTKTLFAASALLMISLVLAIRAKQQIEQARAGLSALARQRAAANEKVARLEARLHTAQAALSELEQAAAATTATPSGTKMGAANAGASTMSIAPLPKLSAQTRLMDDPQRLAQYLKYQRSALDQDYGWIFKRLKLSPQQIEKFKDIEIDLLETSMDLQAAIELHRLEPDSPEYKKLLADYNDSRVTKKAELLGDGIVPYLELYRTQYVRGYAQQLAWTGIFTGEIAMAEQIEQAADILVANSKRRVTDKYPGWVDQSALNWPAAREALKAVLSPTQIAVIGYSVASFEAQRKVSDRTRSLTVQFKKEQPIR